MKDKLPMTLSRRGGLRLGLGAGLALASLSLPVLPALAEDAAVLGFRSARFGMTEDEVRAAIEKDFDLSGDEIEVSTPELARTKVLRITVTNLVEDTGQAAVTYVLGYNSQRLFRVNVVWGTPINPEVTAAEINKVATLLQQYFDKQNFPPENITRRLKINNNTVMLLRASDLEGRTVALLLQQAQVQAEGEDVRWAYLLRLSYILDPENLDVYQLEPGDFCGGLPCPTRPPAQRLVTPAAPQHDALLRRSGARSGSEPPRTSTAPLRAAVHPG